MSTILQQERERFCPSRTVTTSSVSHISAKVLNVANVTVLPHKKSAVVLAIQHRGPYPWRKHLVRVIDHAAWPYLYAMEDTC